MELNKIELKKMTYDFNTVASRIMRAKFDEYNMILAKFLAFIDGNDIIHSYVLSGDNGNFNAEDEYNQVTKSGGRIVFDFGPTPAEETYQIYALLKYILEANRDVAHGMRFQYAGVRNNYNEVIKEFNGRVVLVLIQSIEGHLTKIGYEMGMDENKYFNVNGGQVNIASDNAIINATQNNGAQREDLDSIIHSIINEVSLLDKDNAETIVDSVNMIKEELLKPEPKRVILSNGIKLLAPIITVANATPMLIDNIQALIDYVSKVM